MTGLVFMQVPMPMCNTDPELNVISMLAYIMEDQREALSDQERARIAQWFHDRYTPA